MRMIIAEIALIALGAWLACGIVFAIPFVMLGAGRVDPHAKGGSWGFRLLILPGTVALWPILAWRWAKGTGEPPVERTAHRCAAKPASQPSP
jgi:hypothetical protein